MAISTASTVLLLLLGLEVFPKLCQTARGVPLPLAGLDGVSLAKGLCGASHRFLNFPEGRGGFRLKGGTIGLFVEGLGEVSGCPDGLSLAGGVILELLTLGAPEVVPEPGQGPVEAALQLPGPFRGLPGQAGGIPDPAVPSREHQCRNLQVSGQALRHEAPLGCHGVGFPEIPGLQGVGSVGKPLLGLIEGFPVQGSQGLPGELSQAFRGAGGLGCQIAQVTLGCRSGAFQGAFGGAMPELFASPGQLPLFELQTSKAIHGIGQGPLPGPKAALGEAPLGLLKGSGKGADFLFEGHQGPLGGFQVAVLQGLFHGIQSGEGLLRFGKGILIDELLRQVVAHAPEAALKFPEPLPGPVEGEAKLTLGFRGLGSPKFPEQRSHLPAKPLQLPGDRCRIVEVSMADLILKKQRLFFQEGDDGGVAPAPGAQGRGVLPVEPRFPREESLKPARHGSIDGRGDGPEGPFGNLSCGLQELLVVLGTPLDPSKTALSHRWIRRW